MYGFEKDRCWFVLTWLVSSLYVDFLFTDGHDTDTAKFEKVKVQNNVRLKYKFYKAMLKYLHSGEASVGQQNWTVGIPLRKRTAGGTPSHHHYLVTLLWQVLISQMLIHLDVQMNRYFSKVVWPNCDNITSSWGEVSPRLLSQELYLSKFGDHRPSRSEDNFNLTL